MASWKWPQRRGVRRIISIQAQPKKIPSVYPRLESLEDRLLPASNFWVAGLSTDHNWNTGSNWSLGHAPTTGEIATFGEVGSLGNSEDCTINAGANRCDGITITSFYTGTITVAANVALVGSTGFLQNGGTFNLSSFTLHDAGSWTRSSVMGGTFNAGTGTVDFNLPTGGSTTVQTEFNAGVPFFNLTHSESGTLQLNENLTLVGSLLNSAGTLNANNHNITLQGNWTDNAAIANLATVTFVGTGTENILANSDFNNLFINVSPGNTVKVLTKPLTILGDFSNSSGTFDVNHLDLTVGGNWTNADIVTNTNNVTFNASSGTKTLDNGTSTLINVIHSGAGVLELNNNPLTVTGMLTDSAGTLDAFGLDITVTGLTTISGSTSIITNSGAADALTFTGGLAMTGGQLSSNLGTVVLGAGAGVTAVSDAVTSAIISGTLDLGTSNHTFTVIRGTQNTDLTVSATVVGGANGGISKSGSGIMSLTGSNSYTGGTIVSSGTLVVSANSALGPGTGPGTTVMVGATLSFSGAVNYTTAEPIILHGGTLTSDTSSTPVTDMFAGPINIGAAGSSIQAGSGSTFDLKGSTITMQSFSLLVGGAGNTIIDDTLSGTSAASLTVNGLMVTLNAANTYGGESIGTTVTSGTLAVGNDGSLGTGPLTLGEKTALQAAGGAHSLANSITLTGFVTINGTNSIALNGTISGTSGQLIQADSGTLLLGGANSYGGGTRVEDGILALGTDTGVGTGTLQFQNNVSVLALNSLRILANPVVLGFVSNVTVAGTQDFTFNGVISDQGGIPQLPLGHIIQTDPGVLTLNGANSFGGGITVNAGILSIGNDSALGTGTFTLTDLRTIQAVGGAHTLSNNATFTNRVIISGSNDLTFTGVITSSGANQQLTKVGSANATLSGNSPNFSSAIFVNAGALYVNGLQPNTPITVASGATFGGTGSVGIVTVNGGTLSPGTANAAGMLTTGNVQFNSGSKFKLQINGPASGAGSGELNVNGTVTLGTTNTALNLTGSYVPQPGNTFEIINNEGTSPISGNFSSLPDGSTVSFNGVTMTIHYTGGDGNDVTLSLAPAKSSILGRFGAAGQWWMGASSGSGFTNSLWATWNPNVTWVDVHTGDFNRDGHADIIGRVLESGQWWVGISNGSNGFTTSLWASWNPNVTWVDVHVADFNNDGKSDIIGRVLQTGQWWVGISNGTNGFTTSLWATWNPNVTWVDVQVADFTGDGKADITGRWLQGGSWWTGVSTGTSFTTSMWTAWNPNITWVDVQTGDFNGDGKADIVGRWLQGGQWWVGQSTGSSFTNSLWATWNPNVTWVDVKVADFNGDGMSDIVGRWLQGGQWWAGISTGTSFNTSMWASWTPNVTWVDVQVGDFSGDGKADISGRWLQGGSWWTGVSTGTSFTTSMWDSWNPSANWVDVQSGRYL